MPAFYLLVIIGVVLLWFALAFLFKPVGRFFHRLYQDAIDEMTDDDEQNEDTKE